MSYVETYAQLREPVVAAPLSAPVLDTPHRFDPSYTTDLVFAEPHRCVCGRAEDDALHLP